MQSFREKSRSAHFSVESKVIGFLSVCFKISQNVYIHCDSESRNRLKFRSIKGLHTFSTPPETTNTPFITYRYHLS